MVHGVHGVITGVITGRWGLVEGSLGGMPSRDMVPVLNCSWLLETDFEWSVIIYSFGIYLSGGIVRCVAAS